jgi:hypothetical protein
MKRLVVIIIACVSVPVLAPFVFLMFLFLVVYPVMSFVSFMQGANLESNTPTLKTEYIFTFKPGRVVLIHDEHSQIVRSWGGSPDAISIENGVRTVHFSESAILKTSVDSIEPHYNEVKVKGYLGIYTQDLEFIVDREGEISSVEWE